MLAAGLDGLERQLDAGEPVNENVFEMSARRRTLKIDVLPANLSDALDCLERDTLLKGALGEHIVTHFVEAKRAEWATYISPRASVGDRRVPQGLLTLLAGGARRAKELRQARRRGRGVMVG